MDVNDILKWGKPLTLDEFQTKYMDTNSLAEVYLEDGELLFTFYPYTKLSYTDSRLVIKNIFVDSAFQSGLVYRIECKVPRYKFNSRSFNYICNDTFALQELYDHKSKHIEKVIIDGPATILFWGDGTKTVVKNNEPQESDPEKGILYAIIKKLAPNKKLYNEYLRLIDFELLVEHNTLQDTFGLKEVEK